MPKNILKKTPTKAVVQVIDDNQTISLATDLLFSGQSVSGTPNCTITGVSYSASPSQLITITRNAASVLNITNGTGHLDLFSTAMTQNPTSDIVVVCPVGAMVILEISKVDGYSDTIPNQGVGY